MSTSTQHVSQAQPSRATLVRAWSDALRKAGYVPLTDDAVREFLDSLLAELIDALGQAEYSPQPAAEVGARLVTTGFTGEQSLGATVEILGLGLAGQQELGAVEGLADRITPLLGALTSGYTMAFRRWTLDQQENAKRALLRAERDLRASEARFREVFDAAPLGIAISRLAGPITDTNAAFAEILGRPPAELTDRNIEELFHHQDAGRMSAAYQELASGRRDRFQTRVKLHSGPEEATWGSVAVSVLRDADGSPTHHVTMVEDFGDVQLLEQQLRHQTLHDLLTGLPNQEYFWIHLKAVLEGAEPDASITLCKIDLDRFAAVNDGHGHDAGNRVLRSVAERLQALVAGEQAMVARFGADEFAIIIEDSATTPDVGTLATDINSTLSAPVHLGEHSLAVSAGVGMVRKPPRDMSATDLVRAADATLHRAKRTGRGQWGLHDPQADADERAHYALATAMPAAWHNGQVDLCYQPLIRIDPNAPDSGRITAVAALLQWEHPQRGVVVHEECVALAEQTGLVLSLGPWLLQQACRQLRRWRDELGATPPVRVDLTHDLAQDPDLVAVVRAALDAARLQPEDLQLGMPVDVVVACDTAEDNLRVLSETGVWTVLTRDGQAVGNLALLESALVRAVDIADHLVRATTSQPESVVREAMTNLVPLIRSTGAAVVVAGVHSAEQADWWRQVGADSARGAVFGQPCRAADIPRLLPQ